MSARQATPYYYALISLVASILSVLFLIDPVIRNGGIIDLHQNWLEQRLRRSCERSRRPSRQTLALKQSSCFRAARAPCAGDSGDRLERPAGDRRPLLPTTAPVATAAIGSVAGFFSDADALSPSGQDYQRQGEAL